MKSKLLTFALIAMLVLAACTPKTIQEPVIEPEGTEAVSAFPLVMDNAKETYPVESGETENSGTDDPQSQPQDLYPAEENPLEITVLAPSSTTSIPIMLAAKYLPGMKVEIFENHPQAHAQFMAADNIVLISGLSVGFGMFNNEVPLKLINTNVTGLAYIVSCNFEINNFGDLAGKEIYMPFEGSPMEETTAFFVEKAGLKYGEDVKPIYAPFDTSTALIKSGQDAILAIPQPAATAMAAQECAHLGPSFYDTWNEITGDTDGYPQVGAFAKTAFIDARPEWIQAFNEAVGKAIADLQADPEAAVNEVAASFSLPVPVLLKALQATRYTVQSDQEMKNAVIHYYETIGKPLDEKFEDFFYTLP